MLFVTKKLLFLYMNFKKVYISTFCLTLFLIHVHANAQISEEEILKKFKEGVFAQEKTDYALALNYFESVKDAEPYISPFVKLRIAQCKAELGNINEGIQILEELVSSNKEETAWKLPAIYYLAKFYEKQGNNLLACDYYRSVKVSPFVPWWMVTYLNDCGTFLISTDKYQKEGSEYLQKVVNYAGYNLSRKNALFNLCLSSENKDKIFAIRYLLRGGYLSEAWFILYNNVEYAFLTYIGPSNAVEKWKIFEDAGKSFIAQIRQNKENEYSSILYEYALRCLILSGKYTLANSIFNSMDNNFPANFDIGEFLYWAGQRAEKNKNEEQVVLYSNLLLNRFPQHKRIADILFLLGFWFYNKGDYEKAQDYFEKLERNYPQSTFYSRTLYLLASIFEKKGNKTKVKEYYLKTTQENLGDYYVHLSAEKLRKEFHINATSAKIVPLKNLPVSALQRNKHLFNNENKTSVQTDSDTELKWLFHFSQLGTEEKEWIGYFICQQYQEGKRDEKILMLLSHAGVAQIVWDYMYSLQTPGFANIREESKYQILFPLPYYESVTTWAKKMDIDPYLIWSIMKQESSYRTSVISTSNAKGLLQLLPTTAEWISKKDSRLKETNPYLWKYPDYNIAFGSTYLRYLLDRFQGNIVYALAGYNAGPGRVDEWKKNIKSREIETFIEDIPFTETRNYVKKVLGNYSAYHSLYKEF